MLLKQEEEKKTLIFTELFTSQTFCLLTFNFAESLSEYLNEYREEIDVIFKTDNFIT